MLRSLLSQLLAIPFVMSKPQFLAKWRIKWQGPKPSLALLFKFYRDSDLQFKKGLHLRLLDFKSLKTIEQDTHFFHGQQIEENGAEEKKLLKASALHLYPHEVTRIQIINAQKEKVTSKLYHGGPYQGLDAQTLRTAIRKLCYRARQKGLIIEEVEVAHTHPALEVMVTHQEDSSFFFNGLSAADKKLGQDLAPFVDYPLRIKAISPVASYSSLY